MEPQPIEANSALGIGAGGPRSWAPRRKDNSSVGTVAGAGHRSQKYSAHSG